MTASRREYVLWRLAPPEMIANEAEPLQILEASSCEIEFNILEDEEIKVAPMTKTLVENASRGAGDVKSSNIQS